MPPSTHRLSRADRAELCRRVDLLALLTADGVDVRKNGPAWVCRLRDERTPSCHLYPPGVGRKGADGWTLKDYGDGWGGDALSYLVDRRGLPFADAVAELCALTGFTPDGWKNRPSESLTRAERRPTHTKTTPAPRAADPALAHEKQLDAAAAFLLAVLKIAPEAEAQGKGYLSSRGCLPDGATVGAWVLTADDCKAIAAHLASGPDADLLARAGLLKPAEVGKPARLAWWDRVALLGCYDAAGNLAYFVGRRLDWCDGDRFGKYINQKTADGATRWPFNLPALYHAAGRVGFSQVNAAPDKARELVIVEGPLDALGAACLGWPAVALLTRLQAHEYADRHGAAARMMASHLPALRDVNRVRVVPDADAGEKGAQGEVLAAGLVGWLRYAGVNADVSTLADLCPDAPAGCKDFADVSKARLNPPRMQPLEPAPDNGATVAAVTASQKDLNT